MGSHKTPRPLPPGPRGMGMAKAIDPPPRTFGGGLFRKGQMSGSCSRLLGELPPQANRPRLRSPNARVKAFGIDGLEVRCGWRKTDLIDLS